MSIDSSANVSVDYKFSNSKYWFLNEIILVTKYSEGKYLIKYTMGLLWVPLLDNREKVINLIENLGELVNYYGIEEPEDLISRTYSYGTHTWVLENEAINYLSAK